MLSASLIDGASLDVVTSFEDARSSSEVDVSRCEIAQAFMVTAMVVVIDERADLSLEIAGQIIILKQDAVLERLMPTLDLALRLRVAGRAAHVTDIAFVHPLSQVSRDIGRAIV